jgi:DNA repair photolyase
VRLNGSVEHIFKDWLIKNFPDRASKVWNQISSCHSGKIGDSRKSVRIKGESVIAESIKQLFDVSKAKFMQNSKEFQFQTNAFNYKAGDKQLSLF